jgi:hypothetical protein
MLEFYRLENRKKLMFSMRGSTPKTTSNTTKWTWSYSSFQTKSVKESEKVFTTESWKWMRECCDNRYSRIRFYSFQLLITVLLESCMLSNGKQQPWILFALSRDRRLQGSQRQHQTAIHLILLCFFFRFVCIKVTTDTNKLFAVPHNFSILDPISGKLVPSSDF